jgi:hypothetical protein
MVDSFFGRLPSLIMGLVVFLLFYTLSILVSRVILRTTRRHRPNMGVVFARLISAATILLGLLGDPGTDAVKVRVLWWTKAPRQHQMLASYDRVLTAIGQTLNRSRVGPEVAQNRAA